MSNLNARTAARRGGSRSAHPDPRTIRRALGALERLPTEALADLTERLVDRLDATEPDCDLEPEEDACPAGECGGVPLRGDGQPGDPGDAEADDERDLVPAVTSRNAWPVNCSLHSACDAPHSAAMRSRPCYDHTGT